MSMIEKVAAAIASQHGVSSDPYRIVGHGEFAHFYWAEFTDHAFAAIEAMKEPTNDMLEAFIEAASAQGVAFEEDSPPQYPVPIYQAMIQRALEE